MAVHPWDEWSDGEWRELAFGDRWSLASFVGCGKSAARVRGLEFRRRLGPEVEGVRVLRFALLKSSAAWDRECWVCGGVFEGKSTARYCSPTCRHKARWARDRGRALEEAKAVQFRELEGEDGSAASEL